MDPANQVEAAMYNRCSLGGAWLSLALSLALSTCAVLDKSSPGWDRFEERAAVDSGLQLHYEEQGSGDPILLIHGLGLSSYTWRHWVDPLAEHHRVIAIDLKGFGKSPKPEDEEYTLYEQARLVYQFIVRHDLRNLTLIGHSYGGGVALIVSLYLAENSPHRLQRLILIDSIAYRQRLPEFIRWLATPILGPLLVSLVPEETQVRSIMALAFFREASIPEDAIEVYAKYLKERDAKHALLQSVRQIIPADIDQLAEKYSRIVQPTLILWGREDKIVPLSVGRRLSAAIPRSRLVVFEQTGHIPQEERPAEVLAAIEAFLDGRIKRTLDNRQIIIPGHAAAKRRRFPR
jgi:pimeloyl-ACP methyl ester carboxylesterase